MCHITTGINRDAMPVISPRGGGSERAIPSPALPFSTTLVDEALGHVAEEG